MKAKDIYLGTMKFVWLKLGIGAAVTVASVILLALCMLIGSAFGGVGLYILFIVWVVLTELIYKVIMYYFGYMIKAGHVAVIASAVTTGALPENQFEYGKQMVKSRFAASNVYFVVDRLVSGAVRQLQKVVGKIGGALDAVPGMSQVTNILQTFIGIALGYVDECCLGYCFLKKEQSAFQASCDGVVIYFQNAKKLLKDAAVTTLVVILGTFAAWVIPFALVAVIFRAAGWNMVAGVILALIIAIVIKSAFIDSWMLVKMMVSYMEVAPSTQITFDLYDKLCGLSSKFKELFGKAKAEGPMQIAPAPAMAAPGGAQPYGNGAFAQPAQPTAQSMQSQANTHVQPQNDTLGQSAQPQPIQPQDSVGAQRFCPQCGQEVTSGAAFCNKCGAKLN
ncbi:MAG: zinc ribbon domain-containing protein [bacterium]|nr:zinc ribbon domain-containing protein [bacterium]